MDCTILTKISEQVAVEMRAKRIDLGRKEKCIFTLDDVSASYLTFLLMFFFSMIMSSTAHEKSDILLEEEGVLMSSSVLMLMHVEISTRNVSCLFTLASDAHHYNTRFSQAGTFAMQNSRTQQRIKSFSCSSAKAWNCLSKHKFKAAIHRQLLDILYIV